MSAFEPYPGPLRLPTPHNWSNSKGTTGILVSAVPPDQAAGLWLQASGIARVILTVGRPAVSVRREFFLGIGQAAWLSAAGWENTNLQIAALETGGTVQSAWTTNPPPQMNPLLYLQNVAGAGDVAAPEGAIGVIASLGDPSAVWTTVLGADTWAITAALQGGQRAPVAGKTLTLTAANALCWLLEGI